MTDNNEVDDQVKEADVETAIYKVFLDHRQSLVESTFQIGIGLDKAILTLSAGSLAVSMTFITDIAKTPTDIKRLIVAWFLFGVAIAFNLLSLYCCQSSYGREVKNLDANYKERTSENNKNLWRVATQTGTIISLGSFLAGLLFLGLFIHINLNNCLGDENESTKTKTSTPQTSASTISGQKNTISQSSAASASTANTKKTW